MNTYEIVLTPLYIAPTPDDIIPAFEVERVKVSGQSVDITVYDHGEYFLTVKNGKEIVYMVPAHMVRSCRKIIPKKKAKVLRAIADKSN